MQERWVCQVTTDERMEWFMKKENWMDDLKIHLFNYSPIVLLIIQVTRYSMLTPIHSRPN